MAMAWPGWLMSCGLYWGKSRTMRSYVTLMSPGVRVRVRGRGRGRGRARVRVRVRVRVPGEG